MTSPARYDPDYLKRRHAQEIENARKATDDKARQAHTELADRFATLIRDPA